LEGGSVIRALTEETGCVIDIGEDGTITIASTDAGKAEFAKARGDRCPKVLVRQTGCRNPLRIVFGGPSKRCYHHDL
jgi:hypothetical protein